MSQILPMMTSEEAEREVEAIIVPELADAQARSLVRLIYEVANFENPPQANLAKAIAVAAFRQTSLYAATVEANFQNFVRDAQTPEIISGQKKADELQQTTSSAVH